MQSSSKEPQDDVTSPNGANAHVEEYGTLHPFRMNSRYGPRIPTRYVQLLFACTMAIYLSNLMIGMLPYNQPGTLLFETLGAWYITHGAQYPHWK